MRRPEHSCHRTSEEVEVFGESRNHGPGPLGVLILGEGEAACPGRTQRLCLSPPPLPPSMEVWSVYGHTVNVSEREGVMGGPWEPRDLYLLLTQPFPPPPPHDTSLPS